MILNICFVKNVSEIEKVFLGKVLAVNESYQIPDSVRAKWATDDTVLSAVSDGFLSIGDETNYFSSVNDQVNYLKNNIPITAEISKQVPFGDQVYRTKIDAVASLLEVEANNTISADILIAEDRYAYGGTLIGENCELGDYVESMVYDKDSIIPEAYRAATCEAWPVVNKYIIKEFVKVNKGGITVHELDTRPLIAGPISAGLYIRSIYHAVNSGSTRKLVFNMGLLKKL